MGSLRRRLGFWSAVGTMRLRDLAAPEIFGGLVLGVSGSILLINFATLAERRAVAGDLLTIAGALVGVVFAGFALVIALLSDDYLKWLDSSDSGIVGFLSPFLISIGLQVGSVLSTVIYRALADQVPAAVEHWAFGVACVLFSVAILDVVALARSVLMHGVARSRTLKVRDLGDERARRSQA